MITQQELKELLHYNPETGIFTWIKKRNSKSRVKPGDIAGSLDGGHIRITVGSNSNRHSAQQLAWLWMTGEYPEGFIFHINRNSIDNRWENLTLTRKLDAPELTQEYLKSIMFYDSVTGAFTWLTKKFKKTKIAGFNQVNKYRAIGIDNKDYFSHRLAFLYMTGKFPENDVDHINGDPSDNRWENLREATHQQNACNQGLSIKNTSGHKGIYYDKRIKRWDSYITVDYKRIWLGSFKTKEEASAAYNKAALKYHGEFARLNKIEVIS